MTKAQCKLTIAQKPSLLHSRYCLTISFAKLTESSWSCKECKSASSLKVKQKSLTSSLCLRRMKKQCTTFITTLCSKLWTTLWTRKDPITLKANQCLGAAIAEPLRSLLHPNKAKRFSKKQRKKSFKLKRHLQAPTWHPCLQCQPRRKMKTATRSFRLFWVQAKKRERTCKDTKSSPN